MEKNYENNHGNLLNQAVSMSKDMVALLRDAALLVGAILLLVFPSTFNEILTNAGFEEGSFAGLKWKRQLYDTDTDLRAAEVIINDLNTQNSQLRITLNEAKKKVTDINKRQEIEQLIEASKKTSEEVKNIEASLQQTLATNQPLIEKARLAKTSDSPPEVAYCYQEDKNKDGPRRYSIHCHSSVERCEVARGPNLRIIQTPCTKVDLDSVKWAPLHPGYMSSWYEFRSEPFSNPFPQFIE